MNATATGAAPLLPALFLVTSVWLTLLLCQSLLGGPLGTGVAVPLSFVLVTVLVLSARDAPLRLPSRGALAWLGLGAVAGVASYPAWIDVIEAAGRALGLVPQGPRASHPAPLLALGTLALAPVFEEVLYREKLLASLRARVGACAAVLLSSAAFALPHLEPWAVLGTFLVGLALGTAMCLTQSLALCIGLHAGLNLAAIASAARST